jgi:dTDP-4-amino-4,6-dideoxygalactose transaminase
MTDVEAAVGRIQLSRLDATRQRRRHLADVYEQGLSNRVATPYVAPEADHGYHQYTVRVPHRSAVTMALENRGVGYGIYYPVPVHLREGYRETPVSLPDTEAAANEVLSLPIRPDLGDEEQERVIDAVNAVVQ